MSRFVSVFTPFERFIEKVNKTETCWLWIADKDEYGYGRFRNNGWHGAHRFSYEHFVGQIPKGLVIDHVCRVRHCVNPNHLRIVTNKENILAGEGLCAQNARMTHCKRGHLLAGLNIQFYRGRRCCLVCRKQMERIYRDRRRG